jgi:hypothetical protein
MLRNLRFFPTLTCLICLSSPSTAQPNCFPGYYCPPFTIHPYPGRIPDPNYQPPLGYPQGPMEGQRPDAPPRFLPPSRQGPPPGAMCYNVYGRLVPCSSLGPPD